MIPDSLCRWQVQVSVYCARRIPAHLRYTQCSILLHLNYICFLPCICLWKISQIQTCLCVVVGPGFVSTSHTFMRSSASHPVGPVCQRAANIKECKFIASKDLDKTRIERDEQELQNRVVTIQAMVNSFEYKEEDLISISSGCDAQKDNMDHLLTA